MIIPERPIGVFDSGLGGLTVVKALRKLFPNESIIYIGDTARVPYGNKSSAMVQKYSYEIVLTGKICYLPITKKRKNTPSRKLRLGLFAQI